MDPSNELAVSLTEVGKVFDSDALHVEAVKGASLEIAGGEFVSLLGPSGCGKTTLLRMVADLEQPTTGNILVNGVPPGEARRSRQVGMVFQTPALLEWRTVEGNVALPGEIFEDVQVRERVSEMIAKVGLDGFGHAYPRELSGGMQSRVSIARALTHRPSVLLMDEPFGALDEITRERLQIELLNVWEETKVAVMFVTHSIPEALVVSDRVVVMSQRPGRIIEDLLVDFPRPRGMDTRSDPRFVELSHHLRRELGQSAAPTA